jgi:hypothetical protein
MKRQALVLAALTALLIAGIVSVVGRVQAETPPDIQVDPMTTPTGLIFLQNQPKHWRTCALQNF